MQNQRKMRRYIRYNIYILTFFYCHILSLLEKVRGLLQQHDELKKSEAEFKESCRKDLANLQQQIE